MTAVEFRKHSNHRLKDGPLWKCCQTCLHRVITMKPAVCKWSARLGISYCSANHGKLFMTRQHEVCSYWRPRL